MTKEVARISAQERKLYDDIAEKLGTPGSKIIRMILERVMTPEQAKIVNTLNPPELGVPEEMAKKLGLPKETVDDVLREMMDKGLVVPSRKGGYYLAGSIIQFHDTLPTKKWCDILGPEYMDLWAIYEISERPQQALKAFGFLPSPPFTITPPWRTIKDNPKLIPQEDQREVIRDRRVYAVMPCPCRISSYDCACQSDPEVCVIFDRNAEYQVERGWARLIDYDETLEIFDHAQRDHPLVTQVPLRPKDKINVICHCGMDHCVELRTQLAAENAFGNPGQVDWSKYHRKSRYVAVVDPDKCTGCQTCLDGIKGCIFGVIEMRPYKPMLGWKAWVNPDKCMGCGLCALKCPKQAIKMELARPDMEFKIQDVAYSMQTEQDIFQKLRQEAAKKK